MKQDNKFVQIPDFNSHSNLNSQQVSQLTPLMEFVRDRGRLPFAGELPTESELLTTYTNFNQAFALILQHTNEQEWNAIVARHRSHLLLNLALKNTPLQLPPNLQKFSDFPPFIQNDIKSFFGTYQNAGQLANELSLKLCQYGHKKYCEKSPIGKKLPGALYIHISALEYLNPVLRYYEALARPYYLEIPPETTLIKFNTDAPKISYLIYPQFDENPHPSLKTSTQIDLQTGKIQTRNYDPNKNPPILHRKETFVTSNYPHYQKFAHLTKQEEELGLLDHTRFIGTLQGWQKVLDDKGVTIIDHHVIKHEVIPDNKPQENQQFSPSNIPLSHPRSPVTLTFIDRHKAAMFRKELSKPVRLALAANLLTEETSFFDYGCGYGTDVKILTEKGYITAGWDPYYSPNTPLILADIVNLGYIINVIEEPEERRDALIHAWNLTQKVLIVAAQVLINEQQENMVYGDGIITSRNTFQKYYEQEELKNYLYQVLKVDAIPVGLGIYFVFRDEIEAENFRVSQFHRQLSTPRIRLIDKRFEDYQELLTALMTFIRDRGRLPIKDELPEEAAIKAEFRTFQRAFQVILQVTEKTEWDAIADKRRQDLVVYLALSNFDDEEAQQRPLSSLVRNDIKSLFGSYHKANAIANLLLVSLGHPLVIAETCQNSPMGLNFSDYLLVHISALDELDPFLRVYEGCASRTIGRLDKFNVIKFHIRQPKISYLFYPDFDTESHPILQTSMKIDLRDLRVKYQNFSASPNPQILIRKEKLVTADYPHYEKFAKLSRLEQEWGLLEKITGKISRDDWRECLKENCVKIKDHRIFLRSDADPERVKQLKEKHRERRQNTKKNQEEETEKKK
jgi:DNA phosphorothioation-associated putative methyltransferase